MGCSWNTGQERMPRSAGRSATAECACHGPDRTIVTVFLLKAKGVCDEGGITGLCNDVCRRRQCETTEQEATVGLKSGDHLCIQDKPLLRWTSVSSTSKCSKFLTFLNTLFSLLLSGIQNPLFLLCTYSLTLIMCLELDIYHWLL